MIKRAVVYLRVSTVKQTEGASLDTQKMLCQSWATNNGVLIDHIFHEDGVSAKTLNRPAMKEMLAYITANKGRITYLLTYQTDRITRNAVDFYALKLELSRMGVELKNINSQVGENTANDDLIQGIEAVLAQHDNRQKSDRVTANMKIHAKEGYRMSKAPFGLRNVRDLLGRSTVEAVPDVADKIALLLKGYSTGAYTIAALLEKAKLIGLKRPNGKDFDLQIMGKMLRQPLYAGLDKSAHTEGVLIASKFDGIVTPAVFYANQDLLRKNKNTPAKYKQNNPVYPLRRFMKCMECGKPITGSAPKGGSGKRYPIYHCAGAHKSPSVKVEDMHERFLDMIASLCLTPELEKLIRTLIVRTWQEDIQTLSSREKRLHRALEELRERKNKAVHKLVSGEINKDEKDAYVREVDEEMERTNVQLAQVGEVTQLREDAIDYTLAFMSNIPRLWNNADVDHRLIYQSLIFPNGIEYDLKNDKFGTLDLSQLYRLTTIKKDLSVEDKSLLVNLTTTQVETLFGELEYIEPRLKALGVALADEEADRA